MKIEVLDLGINNLNSVIRAFGINLTQADSISVFDNSLNHLKADLVVLPGLGSFDAGMSSLRSSGLENKILEGVRSGIKIVGICLGMQLLGTNSEESLGTMGLDLIQGSTKKLPSMNLEKVPHTGWAETISNNATFQSLTQPGDFYFVHSYQFIPNENANILSSTPFGDKTFVSAIKYENILGFQFHPEKSGRKGNELIKEIIKWVKNES